MVKKKANKKKEAKDINGSEGDALDYMNRK